MLEYGKDLLETGLAAFCFFCIFVLLRLADLHIGHPLESLFACCIVLFFCFSRSFSMYGGVAGTASCSQCAAAVNVGQGTALRLQSAIALWWLK